MIIHFAHFFHISWLHVFLQWIPFARHATVALMFHILAYRRYLRGGHKNVEKVCEMCYLRSRVLHPPPGEFAFGYHHPYHPYPSKHR
jgi:hypothetical protein